MSYLFIEKGQVKYQNQRIGSRKFATRPKYCPKEESYISNLESLIPQKLALHYATNQSSFNKNDGSTLRASTPPSSCEEMPGYDNSTEFIWFKTKAPKRSKLYSANFRQNQVRLIYIIVKLNFKSIAVSVYRDILFITILSPRYADNFF